jgi:hypothetical protein
MSAPSTSIHVPAVAQTSRFEIQAFGGFFQVIRNTCPAVIQAPDPFASVCQCLPDMLHRCSALLAGRLVLPALTRRLDVFPVTSRHAGRRNPPSASLANQRWPTRPAGEEQKSPVTSCSGPLQTLRRESATRLPTAWLGIARLHLHPNLST